MFRQSLPDINNFLMEVIGEQVCLLRFTGLWLHGILTLCSTRVLRKSVQSFAVLPAFNYFLTEGFFLVGKYNSIELISFRSVCFPCPVSYVFPPFSFRGLNSMFLIDYLIIKPQFTLSFGYSLCHFGCMFVHTFRCNWSLHLSQLIEESFSVHWIWDPFEICPARNFCSSVL